jgi:hypothetical protein
MCHELVLGSRKHSRARNGPPTGQSRTSSWRAGGLARCRSAIGGAPLLSAHPPRLGSRWRASATQSSCERTGSVSNASPPPPSILPRHWVCWLGFACATSVRVCPEIEERPAPVNARPCQPPVCGGCARPWPGAAARSSRHATRATRTICTSTLGTTTASSEACAHRCGRSSCTASEGSCADSVGSPSRQRLGHRPFCRRLRMALANRDRAGGNISVCQHSLVIVHDFLSFFLSFVSTLALYLYLTTTTNIYKTIGKTGTFLFSLTFYGHRSPNVWLVMYCGYTR